MIVEDAREKWLWCTIILYGGPILSQVGSVTVRTPPSTPGIIEAQAKFFQDFFSVQLSPYKIEFGHVCEDPNTWEQRYEKKDFKNHRDMGKVLTCLFCLALGFFYFWVSLLRHEYRHLPSSEDYDQGHRLGSERHFTERHERSRPAEGLFSAKVRWGDKQGGYGEHYWDLNHAGHGNNGDDKYGSDSDDGSYHVHDHNNDDPYDEPSEQSPSYDSDEYNAEKSAEYDESNRAKRDQKKVKEEIIYGRKKEPVEEENQEEEHKKPAKVKRQRKRNHEVLPKENEETDVQEQQKQSQYVARRQPDPQRYVPYEGGAGVRQHQQPEVTAASSSVPRLFLEPSTGHVVDRATGQAYVLQPIKAY